MTDFHNRTFDQIAIGSSESSTRVLSGPEVEALALVSGDVDPFHLDSSVCQIDKGAGFITDAAGLAAMVFGLLNRRLPGPGSTILSQNLSFNGQVTRGDQISASVIARQKYAHDNSIDFDCRCVNQRGEILVSGSARVKAPTEQIAYSALATPEIILRHTDAFARLLQRCKGQPAVICAVVHPCETSALLGPLAAAREGLITPILIGPEAKIRAVAKAAGVDLSPYRIVAVEHSHAAAAKAVAMARAGEVEALMKGSLHTDELMDAVVDAATGLRSGRRISHVFVMDVPAYPRMLLITDAAINIQPTLDEKADIVRNAIDLAHILGIAQPKVAILSAVETVNPKIASTIDASALCKMADRGQISGGILDGPLAFDNAISPEAAKTKNIVSPVAGLADVLVVPDLEAGNMLAKQLQYLSGADSAGIVLGARLPIALSSRADSVRMRLASAAVMALVAHAHRIGAPKKD
ncbi:MAG: bifunctional enoyl-CoA hydratase/phosphate acetyltransferase [Burkholderiaceae bacterium]